MKLTILYHRKNQPLKKLLVDQTEADQKAKEIAKLGYRIYGIV